MSNLNFNTEKSPIVLAVDTSSACAGFALARGSEIIASFNGEASTPHSQTFFLQISELLKTSGVGLGEVQIFAAATGPGSFTGLRVGLAAIKGLAHSLGKPAVGVNSIEAVALSSKVTGDVLVIIEAGRTEVYSGVRRVTQEGDVQSIGNDRVGALALVLSSELTKQTLTVVGNIPKESLSELPNWQFSSPKTSIAEEIALRIPRLLRSGAECKLRPHYVRPSDAEVKRKDESGLEVRINSMLAEHVPAVIELERQCQLSSRGENDYARLLQEPTSVLLVSLSGDSKIVGCFSGWLVADDFEIDNVAVASDWRRSGIGSKLLDAGLQLARQKGAVQAFLEVRSNNIAAYSLYKNHGFAIVGRRKNYYREPVDDALILSKKIAVPI